MFNNGDCCRVDRIIPWEVPGILNLFPYQAWEYENIKVNNMSKTMNCIDSYSKKIPPKAVRKGDCQATVSRGRMLSKENMGEISMYNNNKPCPKMYECSRVTMVPMIRALRRCSAEEAVQSVCANCAERPQTACNSHVLVRNKS